MKKMEQLSKQLYDTLWQIENSIKSWKDDQIARHDIVYNSLFFPLLSNLEYVTNCIKESANLVRNQSQVGIGFVVQLCSTVPILYFFSSRAVWAMSNNPPNFAQAGGAFRNDDDIILNFLVPPIFIQLFFCYKQPPSFYPFSVHSERLGIVSCSGDFWTLWNNDPFLAKDPIPRNFQFIVCARWDYFPRLLRIGHYSSCQTYQCASKSSSLKVF